VKQRKTIERDTFCIWNFNAKLSKWSCLENIVGKFVPATVRGYLKDAGWSASMGYPGIKLDTNGDTVHGFLFYSDNLINH
jgi:hypothetical protein